MAISFPTNPQIGDVYNSGNMSYQWDGTSWAATGASVDLTPKSLGEVATSFDQSNTALIIANTANTTAANVQFRRVSTIAELKTLTPIANMTVQVDGYYTKGDGGGGEFWGNTTSGTHTDNGGTIITSNVIGGTASSSWRRIVDDRSEEHTSELQSH